MILFHWQGSVQGLRFKLNDESEEREFNGVRAAMRALKRKVGYIVTLSDEDEMSFEEGLVRIVPFHKFRPEDVLR